MGSPRGSGRRCSTLPPSVCLGRTPSHHHGARSLPSPSPVLAGAAALAVSRRAGSGECAVQGRGPPKALGPLHRGQPGCRGLGWRTREEAASLGASVEPTSFPDSRSGARTRVPQTARVPERSRQKLVPVREEAPCPGTGGAEGQAGPPPHPPHPTFHVSPPLWTAATASPGDPAGMGQKRRLAPLRQHRMGNET